SMKSSNPQVMVQAYRMLVMKMREEGMNYPLHLGVTEAGEGEDGRIKSAVGIGTLLGDGLGDTIRVSLTEEPEFEIPYNPFEYSRRRTSTVVNIGGHQVPRVVGDLSISNPITHDSLKPFGYN